MLEDLLPPAPWCFKVTYRQDMGKKVLGVMVRMGETGRFAVRRGPHEHPAGNPREELPQLDVPRRQPLPHDALRVSVNRARGSAPAAPRRPRRGAPPTMAALMVANVGSPVRS